MSNARGWALHPGDPEQDDVFRAAMRQRGVRVCFDTCHAWAAGHDLASPGGMAATLDALVATCGTDRLAILGGLGALLTAVLAVRLFGTALSGIRLR